jgi:ABC-type glutathione transport system ATPase component
MSSGALADQKPSEPLLQVRDLTIDLISERSTAAPVVSEVSFQVDPGAIVGLFGECGCGKTTLALALLNLLPASRYRVRGSIQLRDFEVLSASARQLERIRGAEISLVFQDPLLALNPVLRVRDQVAEVMRAHGRQGGLESLFGLVGLPATPRMYNAYPHQLSGGERQRVVIAQALACRPALVIADEPFTALDATRVVELSSLFRELREKLEISFLLISHSPGVLARTADQVLVMQAGRIVERGTPRQVFGHPSHPYTAALLQAMRGTAHGR